MSANAVQSFDVLILYDTAQAGVRAMLTYEKFCRALGDDYGFEVKLWRLDMLELADQAHEMKPRLDRADMVIVAGEAGAESQLWLERWAGHWPCACGEARRALVALYTGAEETKASNGYGRWMETLRQLADRVGRDFITQPTAPETRDVRTDADSIEAESPASVRRPQFERPPQPPAVAAQTAGFDDGWFEMAFPFGLPRWGINE